MTPGRASGPAECVTTHGAASFTGTLRAVPAVYYRGPCPLPARALQEPTLGGTIGPLAGTRSPPEAVTALMPARRTPNYAHRGVYIDYLGRFAWTVDSKGRRSKHYTIFPAENPEDVASALMTQLDELDPIPASDFRPAPLNRRGTPAYLKIVK